MYHFLQNQQVIVPSQISSKNFTKVLEKQQSSSLPACNLTSCGFLAYILPLIFESLLQKSLTKCIDTVMIFFSANKELL